MKVFFCSLESVDNFKVNRSLLWYSRVVIVSSKLHEQGTIDWDVLEGTSRNYDNQGRRTGPNAAYCNSKLANVLFGMQLSEKLAVSNNF